MRLTEWSPQRNADVRLDGFVQVDSRPVRCLCLMPRPPKHVGSFARSQANSETALPRNSESACLCPPLQRGHHRRWDQPEITIQGMRDSPAHQHPRLRKADMVMLVTQSSVSAPQQVGPVRHAYSAACSLQTQRGSHHVACAGHSNTDSEPPSAALRPQTVQFPAPIRRICSHGVCDLRRPACPQ